MTADPDHTALPTWHIRVKALYAGPAGLIENAAVRLRGHRILDVGQCADLPPAADDFRHDLSGLVCPGLVNAHCHLELSDVQRPDPLPFPQWALHVAQHGPQDDATAANAAVRGLQAAAASGTVALGDITTRPLAVREALARFCTADPALHIVSFGEVRGMAARRHLWPARLKAAAEPTGSNCVTAAISPHAPYSLEMNGFQACVGTAFQRGLRIASHIAEHADEASFLSHHTGPLRQLWDTLGGWDGAVPRFAGSPVDFAKSAGLLSPSAVLAHCNYLTDADLATLTRTGVHIAYCPRTHDYFGHPPHRWRDLLHHGINVCIATDSAASSGNLDLFAEARHLFAHAPGVEADVVWEMITWRAARALGLPAFGTITAGATPGLLHFPLPDAVRPSDVLAEVLSGHHQPIRLLPPAR